LFFFICVKKKIFGYKKGKTKNTSYLHKKINKREIFIQRHIKERENP